MGGIEGLGWVGGAGGAHLMVVTVLHFMAAEAKANFQDRVADSKTYFPVIRLLEQLLV